MHDGELGAGQGSEGYLVTGVGVEDVAVVDVGFVGVHVVVAEDVFSLGEISVVRVDEHPHTAGSRPFYLPILVDGQAKAVSAYNESLHDDTFIGAPWLSLYVKS